MKARPGITGLHQILAYTPDIRLVLATTLISNFGIFMVVPFLAIHLSQTTAIGVEGAGLIIGLSYWVQRGGSLVGGLIADRFGVRSAMLGGLFLRVPGYLLFGLGTDFIPLLCAGMLVGFGSALYLPAAKSTLVHLSDEANKPRILALRSIFANIGVAVGPVAGAAVFVMAPDRLFLGIACGFALLLILNARLKIPAISDSRPQFLEGIGPILRNRSLLYLCAAMFAYTAFYMQLEITAPLAASAAYGGWGPSALFLTNALVVIFIQFKIAPYIASQPQNRIIGQGFLALACSFLLFGMLDHGWFALLLGTVVFSLGEVFLSLRLDLDVTHISQRYLGTCFGLLNLAGAFGGVAGSILGAALYDRLPVMAGLPIAWLALAAGAAMAAGLAGLSLKSQTRNTARHATPEKDG